jgi:hypothetical protein
MEYEFKGKKPSYKQVLAKANSLKNHTDLIEIYWGENSITLDSNNGTWHGWGWIKDIDGDMIAKQLNHKEHTATLNLWNT